MRCTGSVFISLVNSGKYDLNLTKPYLAQRFLVSGVGDDEVDEDEDERGFRQKIKSLLLKRTASLGLFPRLNSSSWIKKVNS